MEIVIGYTVLSGLLTTVSLKIFRRFLLLLLLLLPPADAFYAPPIAALLLALSSFLPRKSLAIRRSHHDSGCHCCRD